MGTDLESFVPVFVLASIENIIEYYWKDEESDFQSLFGFELDDNVPSSVLLDMQRSHHIFADFQHVADWLRNWSRAGGNEHLIKKHT